MDGCTGYATAVDQVLPQARKVMDPFHVVHLAADKLTGCRQRLHRETTRRRGRKDDPLYKHRRTLLTRTNYLTERQGRRLDLLWATDGDYMALEVTWMALTGHDPGLRAPEEIAGQEADGTDHQHPA
ncbi:transposase [Corynebacterium freneyi]|nr:transposase [Corynebacterium freneyi]MDK8769219.1 transposase [Corynebacterium freneyi]